MTVIAYRDGVMASDSMFVFGDKMSPHEIKAAGIKLIQRRGHLLGVAGDNLPENSALLDWFFEGLGNPTRPKFKHVSFTLLVVGPDGAPTIWMEDGVSAQTNTPFMAIGSGRDLALGAMAMGADAVTAVKTAIKWSPSCGGRVQKRTLRGGNV